METHTARRSADEAARRAWGQWFRLRRSVRGLSMADVAEACGVSKGTVQQWEAGSPPSSLYMLALAAALDVDLYTLARACMGRMG